MAYPTTLDNIPQVTDDVTDAAEAIVNPWVDAINAIEAYVGVTGDVAASSGTLTSQIKYLLAAPGGIAKQDAEPGTPEEDDLWLETDNADRPLYIRVSSAWQLLGANALELDGLTVDAATPTDGQVLTWDNDASEWIAAAPSGGMTDPMGATGDIIYRNSTGAPAALGIGTEGQILRSISGLPDWTDAPYIAAPGSPQQGDVLYRDASTWVRLAAGTAGQFLQTQGASSNPRWWDISVSPPGSAIESPSGSALGDLLYFNDPDWDNLASGTSGLFLKSNGPGTVPTWASPAGGMTNPMTTGGDLIYGDSGGTPLRRAIGTNGTYLGVVAGAPQWVTAPAGFEPDYATINWMGGD